MIWAKASGGIIVFIAFFVYGPFLNHHEPNEVGIAWNMADGTMTLQSGGGWYITSPWVLVAKADTRPMRVCITTSAHAAFNCRLVQFVPANFKEFVDTEGFRFYWWSNRLSFNIGYDDEYRGFRDVMRGYAFSVTKYSFIKVLDEYEEKGQ